MAFNTSNIGLQRQRQYAGPLDIDVVFATKADMTAYLQRAIRYAGMIVTCLEEEGSLFILNNAKNAWLKVETSNESVEVPVDYSFTRNDIVANVAVGGITKGTVIPKGTRLENFLINHLFKKIPEPVKTGRIVQPSFTLGNTGYWPYIGSTITYTVTFENVSRGSVIGDYVSENWQPNTVRGDWAGLPLEYRIDDEVITQTGGVYSKTFTDVVVTSTPIRHTCEIDFDDGSTTRINSEGTTSDTFVAGTLYRDTVVTGRVMPVPEPEITEEEEEINEVSVAYPTFTTPAMQVTATRTFQEDGTLNVILTVLSTETALRASIQGDLVSGVWSPTATQDFLLGEIIGFSNGTSVSGAGTATTWGNSAVKTKTINVLNVNQTIFVAMQHGEGVQPVDSSGANYGDPEPAGYITTAVNVARITPPTYYYTGVLASPFLFNATSIFNLSKKTLPTSGQFTAVMPAGTTEFFCLVIAYPTTRKNPPIVIDASNMPTTFTYHSIMTIGGVECYVFYYNEMAVQLDEDMVWAVTI